MSTPSLFNAPPLQTPTPKPTQETAQVSENESEVGLNQDEIKRALPAHLRSSVTPELVSKLNTITTDPEIAQNIRENFIGYSAILKDGKFKTEEYLNAVAYVSFKLMGHSNHDAYVRTFPQRYANLMAKGTSSKDIAGYVAAYHRGKLVNLIMEQSLVPTWVLNQDLFQKALNVQAELMLNANSEKVRTDAANSLLTHLKKPEVKGGVNININGEESAGMKEMREMMAQLAQQQRDLIQSGEMKTIDVAGSRLVPRPQEEDVTDV